MTTQNVQQFLLNCLQNKTPVFISSNGLNIAFQTLIRQIDGNELLVENMVRPQYIRAFTNGDCFYLQCKMMRLQTTVLTPQGSHMSFLMQENSIIEETRQSERFMFSPNENVVAEFINPYDHITKIQRPVMDMSASGLSVRLSKASKLFDPGTKIPNLHVIIDGKPYSKNDATVVYGRQFMDFEGKLQVQVGLKFS